MTQRYWLRVAIIILLAILVMIIFNDVPAAWVSSVLVPLVIIIRSTNRQAARGVRFTVAIVAIAVLLMGALVFIVSNA